MNFLLLFGFYYDDYVFERAGKKFEISKTILRNKLYQ